jgi:hypothetical protein
MNSVPPCTAFATFFFVHVGMGTGTLPTEI